MSRLNTYLQCCHSGFAASVLANTGISYDDYMEIMHFLNDSQSMRSRHYAKATAGMTCNIDPIQSNYINRYFRKTVLLSERCS